MKRKKDESSFEFKEVKSMSDLPADFNPANFKAMSFTDIMDDACACALEVSVEEYIRVVEDVLSFNRADAFVSALLSENEEKRQQCIRIYKNYIQDKNC
jgi:hypothetical protein